MGIADKDRKSNDIVFVNPYFLGQEKTAWRDLDVYPPMGIMYLASTLKQAGFKVRVIDGTFTSLERVFDAIQTCSTRFIGISANIITRNRAIAVLEYACDLGIPVLVGGPDPSTVPELYLESGAEAVFMGEGETAIIDYLTPRLSQGQPILSSIDGVRTKADSGPDTRQPLIADLSTLPKPDYSIIDIDQYLTFSRRHKGFSMMPVLSARGCPFPCSWCAKPVFGANYRAREPVEFVDEIDSIVTLHAPDRFRILDDVFTLDRERTLAICTEIQRRKLSVQFECLSRIDCLDPGMLQALKAAGCYRIWCGVESGSEKVLKAMHKNVTQKQIREAARMVHAVDIELACFLLTGYPGESWDDVVATLQLIDDIQPDDVSVSIAYPIPGTAFYEQVEHLVERDVGWKHSSQYCPVYKRQYPDLYYKLVRNLILRKWDRKIRLKNAPRHRRYWNAIREATNWLGCQLMTQLTGKSVTGE